MRSSALTGSEGSSPLARGLRDALLEAFPAIGIIPARAGFTHPTWTPARYVRDHPRSRGVYPAWVRRCSERTGSSPLARGLLDSAGFDRVVGGIIPARAGFTS